MTQHTQEVAEEVAAGERFGFGENWQRFLYLLNAERIALAEKSLCDMLGVTDLHGRSFLDVGSGSGLFSLAARRLGARVHSFDYDPQSVACTAELKHRYFPDDADWSVESGSVLDSAYLQTLGQWDVVYSWGVLHHTGAMRQALDNVAPLVRAGGGGAQHRHLQLSTRHDACVDLGEAHLQPPARRAALAGARACAGPALGAENAVRPCARQTLLHLAPLCRARLARHERLAQRGRLGGRVSVRGRQARGYFPLLPQPWLRVAQSAHLWRRAGLQ